MYLIEIPHVLRKKVVISKCENQKDKLTLKLSKPVVYGW